MKFENDRLLNIGMVHRSVPRFAMRFSSSLKKICIKHYNDFVRLHLTTMKAYSFSLYYNDIARWLFITLAFTGILSTARFAIPLALMYLANKQIDLVAEFFSLLSLLATIWGLMAYREFTKSGALVIGVRDLARKLDPIIGNYYYLSYNPETKEYETGYLPIGPMDFWDKETQVPGWLDKGKYWHILLGLQVPDKEIIIQVVRDEDLPFSGGRRNVAITFKEQIPDPKSERQMRKHYRYRIMIPQWLVMNTDRVRFGQQQQRLNLDDRKLASIVAELNRKIVFASQEIIERERPRVKYPWTITGLGIYLNKSLPLRIIYREAMRHLPGAKKRAINYTNENLANIPDDELIAAIIQDAIDKDIPDDSIHKIRSLIRFLQNAYTTQGIGEGSSEYHNFHHSLEVEYMSLKMLPREFHGYKFSPKDYELILVAGLLHDYDPAQLDLEPTEDSNKVTPKGPRVIRTINEIERTGIHYAYFKMNCQEYENYFSDFKSTLLPSTGSATTDTVYSKAENRKSTEAIIVEALIWRTDFPYFKQEIAQKKFAEFLKGLENLGKDPNKIKLIGEILWLADLSVTYMGSDPLMAWDRVTNLYEELYLPKVEAVLRTDAFFSDFAETDLFKELINTRHFPTIFRQRWNLVYQFFHEGNPSTQLNRTIQRARKLYLKVNVEIEMNRPDILEQIGVNNWAEYFIGIGKDRNVVVHAKIRFADLDPPNASSFWGDSGKLIPSIGNKAVDNFLLVFPERSFSLGTAEGNSHLASLVSILPSKLRPRGSLQVLTQFEETSRGLRDLISTIVSSGFYRDEFNIGKVYFPKKLRNTKDSYLIDSQEAKVLLFRPKE